MDAVKTVKFWGIGSAAVLGLSVILPWVSAFGTTVALIEETEFSCSALSALTIAAILWRSTRWPARLMAVLAAGFGLYEAIRIWVEIRNGRDEAEGFGALISAGMGLYIAALAALSLAIWAGYLQVRKTAA